MASDTILPSNQFGTHSEVVNLEAKVEANIRNYLTCALSAILLIFFLLNKIRQSTAKKTLNRTSTSKIVSANFIPYIQLPFLNHLFLIYQARKDVCGLGARCVKKFGPNFRMTLAISKVVVLTDPPAVQKLLSSKNPGHLSKSQFRYNTLFTELLQNGLIVSRYEVWAPHRKAISPAALSYKSLQTYLRFITTGIEEFAKSATETAANNLDGVIGNDEMKMLINRHAVNIITRIIMGSEGYNLSSEKYTSFHKNFQRVKDIGVKRFFNPLLVAPPIWWFHPMKRELDQSIAVVRQICNEMSDNYRNRDSLEAQPSQREKIHSSSDLDHDEENELKRKKEEEEEMGIKHFECLMEKMIKAGFSNAEIADEVATFLTAGHETILVALDMLIFNLARNMDHQEKCRAEVDELLERKGHDNEDQNLSIEDFSQLKYLGRCILENLRMYPSVPAFTRKLNAPLKIDDGEEIKSGELISVPIWLVHRNENIYPNPEVFDPDRFLPENVRQRHPYAFIPFSMGMRNCVGYKIALLELKVMMTYILRNFEMTTTDKPEDVRIDFHITLKPERNFAIKFKRRILEKN